MKRYSSRLMTVFALAPLLMAGACSDLKLSLPGIQNPYVDPLFTNTFAIEYLRMQARIADSTYNIFDSQLTQEWINQRLSRMGTKWSYREGDKDLAIDTLPADDPTFIQAYVESTATRYMEYAYLGEIIYSYHLYAVDRFSKGYAVDNSVGGLTASPPVRATFIPVGLALDEYYDVFTPLKAKNLLHEYGHLRAQLMEYCYLNPADHVLTSDSVCVMSDACYDIVNGRLLSHCAGTCGSQYAKLSFEFCSICSTNMRNAPNVVGAIVQ